MNDYLTRVSATARNAAFSRDWPTVDACAREILKHDSGSPEGYFLSGLVDKASGRAVEASVAFAKALELDDARYDAAIELASQHCAARRNGAAAALVTRYEPMLANSPLYLNMAGSVYSGIGMPERAWPLYRKADELQPGVDLFQSDVANCGVFLGKIGEARDIYTRLLEKYPTHQRYHYQLARLATATDTRHIEQMKAVLRSTNLPPDKNIFMYYAIGKELEDLEAWDEAFRFYKMAGDAVASVADYDIEYDLGLIDKFIETCDADWLGSGPAHDAAQARGKTPVFVVGLPRTGTTLIERILASHSQLQSVGETQFMQMVLRRESGVVSDQKMTREMIGAAGRLDIGTIGSGYMDMLDYKLGSEPLFVDKLPFNIYYLGFIAKAFPGARIIHVRRNPMDSCFAMYKQVFTWAYKFSYTLEGLGRFYPAYARLVDHWREVLGDRIVGVDYEALVTDQESQTRRRLAAVGADFEEACLSFEKSGTATITASAVQVREKIHSRSVDRWRNFAEQLSPLKETLERAGIAVE